MSTPSLKVHSIAAVDQSWGIGKKNDLPWRLKSEMKHFVRVTTAKKDTSKKNAVLMGRRTWESIPNNFKPLKNRLNVVLSGTMDQVQLPEGVLLCRSLEEAVQRLSQEPDIENVFCIGGASAYRQLCESSALCGKIYLTHIQGEYDCDVFYPRLDTSAQGAFKEVTEESVSQEEQEEEGVKYSYKVYERC